MYQGWKVTMAGTGINFLIGICYTWSIFAGGLSREFGWTQAEAALPYTVYIISYAVLMIVAGRFQDRFGPRLTVTIGGFFVGGAFIASSFFLHPYGVAIIWGLLFGTGLACCFGSVTPAAVKWFPHERRGFITGIVVAGLGISALFLAPLVDTLVVKRGVISSFLIVGVILVAGIALLAQFLSIPVKSAGNNPVAGGRWQQIFSCPQLYLLWLMFFLTTSTGITFATHLVRISEVHASFAQGYIMVAFFALFNGVGRLGAGTLSDVLGRVRAMTLVFGVMTITMASLLSVNTALPLAVATSFLGLTYGGVFTLFPATTLSYFGEENFGFNYGLVFSALACAGLFSLAAGYLFDLRGNFYAAFLLLALFCLASTVASLFLKNPETKAKSEVAL